jgi:hypothetical protein
VLGACDWWPRRPAASSSRSSSAPLARNRAGGDLRPGQAAERLQASRHHLPADARRRDLGASIMGRTAFLSTAAHGHADALAFELAIGGRPVLIDPGTYCYQGEPEWRAISARPSRTTRWRSAASDQAVQAGPVPWSTHADELGRIRAASRRRSGRLRRP